MELKALMEGLQILQFANLGATLVGIGVSAIGFAMMNKKLEGLSDRITNVEALIQELKLDELRTRIGRTRELLRQADQADDLSDAAAAKEWRRIAGALADEGAYFRDRVEYLLSVDGFDSVCFKQLTYAYAWCNSGRIKCDTLAGELRHAQRVSQDVASDYNKLFDDLTPIDLAHRSMKAQQKQDTSSPEGRLLRQELRSMDKLVNSLRDLQDAAWSVPFLFDTLMQRSIEGREYINSITKEENEPILVIEASH